MITVNAFMGDAYSFPNLRKMLTFLVCKDILSHFSQTKNNSNSSFSLLPPNSPHSTYLMNLLHKSSYPSNDTPNQQICIYLLCLSLFLSFLLLTLSRTLSLFQFHTFHSFLKTTLPFHNFFSSSSTIPIIYLPQKHTVERDSHQLVVAQVLREVWGRFRILLDGRWRRIHEETPSLKGTTS